MPRPSGPYDPSALWQVSNPTVSASSPIASSASAIHDQSPLDIDGDVSTAVPGFDAVPAAATAFKPPIKSVSAPPISKSTAPLPSPSSSLTAVKASQAHDLVKASAPLSKASSTISKAAFGTGAASAPAPARSASDSAVVEPSGGRGSSEVETAFGKSGESGKHEYGSVSTADAPSFSMGDAESSSGGSKRALVGMAAAVVVATCLYFGWTQFHRPATPTSSASTDSTPTAAVTTVTTHGSNTQSVAFPTMAPPSPSASTSSPSAKPILQSKAGAKSAAGATVSENSDPSEKNTERETKDSQKSSNSLAAAKAAPEVKSAPAPIVVKKGAASPTEPADAPAPSVLVATTGAGGSLPNLIGDPGISAKPVLQTLNISQGVSQGLLMKKVQPSYPPNALRMHVEGAVQLLATIGKSGNITAVKTLSGEPLLARAALDAVKQWKYKPYYLNGEPVEIQTQVTVNFKLPR
jgi:TonB family protein